jgi:hypothetical protein
MKDTTPTQPQAVLSLIAVAVAVLCLSLDIYLLVSSHQPHNQTFRIACLPLFAGGAAVFFARYRNISARKSTSDPTSSN